MLAVDEKEGILDRISVRAGRGGVNADEKCARAILIRASGLLVAHIVGARASRAEVRTTSSRGCRRASTRSWGPTWWQKLALARAFMREPPAAAGARRAHGGARRGDGASALRALALLLRHFYGIRCFAASWAEVGRSRSGPSRVGIQGVNGAPRRAETVSHGGAVTAVTGPIFSSLSDCGVVEAVAVSVERRPQRLFQGVGVRRLHP
jgi:hypothetical protein